MSSYENYTRTSNLYDRTRGPVGVEIILGCIGMGPRPSSECVLVDAGCGTGNYSKALISRVARVEAVDLNQGMLARAKVKLESEAADGRVGFHQAPIGALPLDDRCADGVMVNQVLHHVDDDSEAGWPAVAGIIGELARVLRPGGVLVVNVCTHEQLARGWWYMPLISDALARMRDRHIPLEALEAHMSENNLQPAGSFVPVDGLMQGPSYFNGRGPLDESWRAGDSIWAMVEAGRLAAVQDRIRELDAAGRLDAFVRENDAYRRHIGQFTFLCARKPQP